ncbi:MAG: peptide chain release factor 1 [Myxococcota bacterium]|jgi:peptide chain release factor 1
MRFQRVPPSEKRGRVHTSTVTVSVLPEAARATVQIPDEELRWSICRAGGKGGQHVNKSSSAVQLMHLPTGIQFRVESSRSQHLNREAAHAMLAARLLRDREDALKQRRNKKRREQTGSGMRADKRRTIALQRDSVVDHRTGQRTTWRRYVRGHVEDLWR